LRIKHSGSFCLTAIGHPPFVFFALFVVKKHPSTAKDSKRILLVSGNSALTPGHPKADVPAAAAGSNKQKP
jgi:hypothetical protein